MEDRMVILNFLQAGGRIKTRLREGARGDTEFLQHGLWDVPENASISEAHLITVIRSLEADGLVEANCQINAFDPIEFLLTWRAM